MPDKNLVLASIIDSADDAILSKDLDGNIQTWNHGAEVLYQYPEKEMIGKNISLLLPDDRPNEVKNILLRIKNGEKVEHFETKRKRKDGTIVDVSLTISPIKDSRGKIIGASSIAEDITKQLEKTKELERMNKLMVNRELRMIELKKLLKNTL